jgi:hypothetical protein
MAYEAWFEGDAQEIDTEREGTPFSVDNVREYIRRFRVIAKDKRMGPLSVCYCNGIPLPWSFYMTAGGLEYDTQARAVRFEAAQENPDDWPNWIVTVTYSTQLPPGGVPTFPGDPRGPGGAGRQRSPKGSQTEPELEPPEISWDEDIIRYPLPRDLDGKAFLNTAQLPLAPAPMFDFPYNTLTVARNDVKFDPNAMLEYAMSYNSDTFMGAPPGCAQCLPVKSKLTHKGTIWYHRSIYRIRFVPNILIQDTVFGDSKHRLTWKEIESTFLNAGSKQVSTKEGKVVTWKGVIGADGHPINEPMCLAEDGTQLHPNDLRDKIRMPYWLEFRVRESKEFKKLFARGLQTALVGRDAAKYWDEEE